MGAGAEWHPTAHHRSDSGYGLHRCNDNDATRDDFAGSDSSVDLDSGAHSDSAANRFPIRNPGAVFDRTADDYTVRHRSADRDRTSHPEPAVDPYAADAIALGHRAADGRAPDSAPRRHGSGPDGRAVPERIANHGSTDDSPVAHRATGTNRPAIAHGVARGCRRGRRCA